VNAGGPTSAWRPQAQQALRELSDPAIVYLPRAEALMSSGRHAEAQELLAQAQQVQFPKDAGRILAWSSMAKLNLAKSRGKGKVSAEDKGAALKDAEAAIKAGAGAEGHFAAGRVEEEAGQAAAAERHYRDALIADPASAIYKLAIARVLLQPRVAEKSTRFL